MTVPTDPLMPGPRAITQAYLHEVENYRNAALIAVKKGDMDGVIIAVAAIWEAAGHAISQLDSDLVELRLRLDRLDPPQDPGP